MNTHAIVGTDFSNAFSSILKNAAMLKTIGIKKISLVHVINLRDVIMVEQFTIDGLEKKLAEQKSFLENLGIETEAELLYGIPFIELEKKRQKSGAGVIIIGSNGRTSSSSKIGGTTADILENLKAPVLVITLRKEQHDPEDFHDKNLYQYENIYQQLEKHEPEWEVKCSSVVDHVLLPTDFSDFSENAFQWIKKLPVKIPKLTLLHVQDEVKIGSHLEHKLDEFNKIDSARLIRIKEAFIASHPETPVDYKIIYGKPKEVIINFIKKENVTLTVMGSQGRGFFEEIFIGSVSHQVARNADANILIVPLPKT